MPHRMRPLLCCLLALILVCTAISAPVIAEPAEPDSLVSPDCVRVTGVTLTGPVAGDVGQYLNYTATAQPADATLDIDYSWVVTDYPRFSSTAGLSQTQEFAWNTNGTKTVNVRVRNCGDSFFDFPQTLTVQLGPVALTDVPDQARQLALLHLQEVRGSGEAPEWQGAYLAPGARPLYRPDMTEPAYYEFSVLAPPQEQEGASASAVVQDVPTGFIVVSTGPHDYPVPHWATSGDAPTERMRQKALLSQLPAPVRFYRLDALSYTGEDALGNLVATDGDLPQRVVGIPDEWLTAPPPIMETHWRPAPVLSDDEDVAADDHIETILNEPLEYPVHFEGWDSWNDLKGRYEETFAPFLDAQRASASLEWEVLQHAAEHGHVLYLGESLSFPLLWETSAIDYVGPAWDQSLVSAEVLAPEGSEPVLRVTAVAHVPGQSVPMEVHIAYANGMSDTLRVMVLYRSYVYLPLVMQGASGGATPGAAGGAGGVAALEAGAQSTGTLAADGYTYWYATSQWSSVAFAQQVDYGQYKGTDVIGNCMTGCGPTAWAMLIAWGDRAASAPQLPGFGIWAGRWGLYRYNGGKTTGDAVAPKNMRDPEHGPGIENITWEINGYLNTFCNPFNDNGATLPTDMHRITQYLNGRSGMEVKTWANVAGFDVVGYTAQSIAEKARNVIQNPMEYRRPTVIGIGFLSHYPLAFGYRTKPLQYCTTACTGFWGPCTTTCYPAGIAKGWLVNQGNNVNYGEYVSTKEWIASDLFFAGRLTPHRAYVDDVGLYRASNAYFYLDYQHDAVHDRSMAPFGWPTGIRVTVGDFDRDGVLDDLAAYIWSGSDNLRAWRIDYNMDRTSNDYNLAAWSSISNAFPMALDVDRNGWVDDMGLYQPAQKSWVWNRGSAPKTAPDDTCSYATVPGFPTDGLPVTGDFNNDGYHDDVAIYSASQQKWYFDYRSNGCGIEPRTLLWGTSTDLPVAGDFDKDGYVDDLGLFSGREGGNRYWYYNYNGARTGPTWDYQSPTPYGTYGDMPFSGNLDTN